MRVLGTRLQLISCLTIFNTYITGNQVEKRIIRKIQTLYSLLRSKQLKVVVLIVYDTINNTSKWKRNWKGWLIKLLNKDFKKLFLVFIIILHDKDNLCIVRHAETVNMIIHINELNENWPTVYRLFKDNIALIIRYITCSQKK